MGRTKRANGPHYSPTSFLLAVIVTILILFLYSRSYFISFEGENNNNNEQEQEQEQEQEEEQESHPSTIMNDKALSYSLITEGEPNTLTYRMYFEESLKGIRVSPWHDIPLLPRTNNNKMKGKGERMKYTIEKKYYGKRRGKMIDVASSSTFNLIIEIPRGTQAKLEISRDLAYNPIIHDVRANGKARYVTWKGGYLWNYGAFPQTWEDPAFIHPETNTEGDKDPLDAIEIGSKQAYIGEVKEVKVLGVMALVDEQETDWKVITIDINDPLASKLNDIDDIEEHMPGLLHETYEWFRDYKTPHGKPPNKFAFGGKAKPKDYALNVIKENYELWLNGPWNEKT